MDTSITDPKLEPELATAFRFIRKHQCNSFLNLTMQKLSPELWYNVQTLLLNDMIFPPITRIRITKSNIKFKDVDDRLQHMIVE